MRAHSDHARRAWLGVADSLGPLSALSLVPVHNDGRVEGERWTYGMIDILVGCGQGMDIVLWA